VEVPLFKKLTEFGLSVGSPKSALKFDHHFMSSFYHTKVFCTAFICLHFGLVSFCHKNIDGKAAHKMLVKFEPGRFSAVM